MGQTQKDGKQYRISINNNFNSSNININIVSGVPNPAAKAERLSVPQAKKLDGQLRPIKPPQASSARFSLPNFTTKSPLTRTQVAPVIANQDSLNESSISNPWLQTIHLRPRTGKLKVIDCLSLRAGTLADVLYSGR